MKFLVPLFLCCALSMPANAGSLSTDQDRCEGCQRVVPVEAYDAASKLLDQNLREVVLNDSVRPHWLPNGQFWYRREAVDGVEYVVVDPEKLEREPAFRHEQVFAQIASLTDGEPNKVRQTLVIDELKPGTSLSGKWEGGAFHCDLGKLECTASESGAPSPDRLYSPDNRLAVFSREHDLWAIDLETGAERQLSDDGVAYFAYGKLPDTSLFTVALERHPQKLPPYNTFWSPDSRYVISTRIDEREVGGYPFVEWVPEDGSIRPKVYEIRSPLMGDVDQPRPETRVFDLQTGRNVVLSLPDGFGFDSESIVGWAPGGESLFAVLGAEGFKSARLVTIDLSSGQASTLFEERAATHLNLNPNIYNRHNIHPVNGGGQFVWYSERSGWGHLELIDAESGKVIRSLTSGDWVVFDVLAVDEARGRVLFTAGGREPGRNPYYAHVYSVTLDGGDIQLLTPEDAHHWLETPMSVAESWYLGDSDLTSPSPSVSPDLRFVVDSYSRVDLPAETVLRSAADGRVLMRLESADASALRVLGWREPEPFTVKSADGRWDLHGLIYWPYDMKAGEKVPVIDAFYGGPQESVVPVRFREAYTAFNPVSASSLARLGFAVVIVDGSGTPMRAKAFQDAGYGNFADVAVDDHVAAIRQLAERHPELDIERVGTYGHSFGGYTTARAILRYPDFYKVAVSSAGSHNFQGMYQAFSMYLGIPRYADGGSSKTQPGEVPPEYAFIDNATLAQNLVGHLMLVYGDMDENAYPAVTIDLMHALIEHNKSFDLMYLPNRTHSFYRDEPYYIRRMWDYFVEHLLDATPPLNYELEFSNSD